MTDVHEERDQLTSQVKAIEAANRTPEMLALMADMIAEQGDSVLPDKIKVVSGDERTDATIGLFKNSDGEVQAAPIDPIVISYYEYTPTSEQEAERRENHAGLREGVTISEPLTLVEQVNDPATEISAEQLIAIQNQLGNNSTWWPIKDYTPEEVSEVFDSLELHVVYRDDIPVGVGHYDTSKLEEEGSVKVVFVALDPLLHGKGMGKEILNEMMSQALDMGAETVTLDTVHHRDVRSDPGTELATQAPAAGVYEKAGFELAAVELVDPGNLPEGVTVNQLNGPLEYIEKDMDKLRLETLEKFGIDPEKGLETMHSWQNEASHLRSEVPTIIVEGTQTMVNVYEEGRQVANDGVDVTVAANTPLNLLEQALDGGNPLDNVADTIQEKDSGVEESATLVQRAKTKSGGSRDM